MARQRVIEDWAELERLFRSGMSPKQISETYAERGVVVAPGTLAVIRHRKGWNRVHLDHSALLPWLVRKEHRGAHHQRMLRLESTLRQGGEVDERNRRLLESWKKQLKAEDAVVHYQPDTPQGWFLVPRRPGVDTDLIRVPDPEDESVPLRV